MFLYFAKSACQEMIKFCVCCAIATWCCRRCELVCMIDVHFHVFWTTWCIQNTSSWANERSIKLVVLKFYTFGWLSKCTCASKVHILVPPCCYYCLRLEPPTCNQTKRQYIITNSSETKCLFVSNHMKWHTNFGTLLIRNKMWFHA